MDNDEIENKKKDHEIIATKKIDRKMLDGKKKYHRKMNHK